MRHRRITVTLLLFALLLTGCGGAATPAAEPTAGTTLPTVQTQPTQPVTQTQATTAPTEEAVEEPFVVEIIPVITEEQTTVTVKTADQFLAAIAPNTEIVVDAELIDLSKASGYGKGGKTYYTWMESFDGPELYITGVTNLTIRGAGEDRTAVVISATPRYADVLSFENCSNVQISGLTAGHTKEPSSCAGGVLCFENCQDILVENCGLFGCGTLGVTAYSSKNIQIVNNEIYECSVGGVEFTNCDAVNVDGNTFRDLGGPIFRIYDCGTVTCNGKDAVPFG